jgi:hypothetical protein
MTKYDVLKEKTTDIEDIFQLPNSLRRIKFFHQLWRFTLVFFYFLYFLKDLARFPPCIFYPKEVFAWRFSPPVYNYRCPVSSPSTVILDLVGGDGLRVYGLSNIFCVSRIE